VWLLIPITNNFTLILFWNGAGLNTNAISSYYILMTIGGLLITSHTEYEVSEVDIKQGGLVNYLTKPISYYLTQLLSEIPYRILHAVYASFIIGGILLFLPGLLTLSLNVLYIPLVILIFILGYLISFTFKMSMAYTSFWFKDATGLFELCTIVIIIFSGGVMPLPWYPPIIQAISTILPFAYSGYYCITALQGSVPLSGLFHIILIQGMWLAVLLIIHNILWSQGIKKFTAVGQ